MSSRNRYTPNKAPSTTTSCQTIFLLDADDSTTAESTTGSRKTTTVVDQRTFPAGIANTRYGTPSSAGKAARDQGERSFRPNHSPSPKPKNHSGASKSPKLKSAGRNCPARLAAIPDLAIPARITSRMHAYKAIAQVLRVCSVVSFMRLDGQKRTGEQKPAKEPISPPVKATSETLQSPLHPAGSDGRVASADAQAGRCRRFQSSGI